MHLKLLRDEQAGYTLAQLMVGVGVASVVLLGLVLGSISLQRSFVGTDQYATAQDAQLRVMDYITRDLRRAKSVSVTPDGSQVSVTVPDYYSAYDSNGNPSTRSNVNSQPLDPVITTSSPVFGSNAPTITYYVDATTQSLIRQVNWTAGGTAKQSSTTIADAVQSFQLGFTNTSNSVVTVTITFAPILERNSQATARAGTTLSASVTLRDAPL